MYITRIFTNLVIRALRGTFSSPNDSPLFVLGNQKSGTTVIASLLAEISNQSVALDLRGLSASFLEDLYKDRKTIADLITRFKLDFSKDIIKEPGLTYLYNDIKAHFPTSRFIFIVRDPRDNVRSILDRLHIPGHLAQLEPKHLEGVSAEWRQVIDGAWMGLEGTSFIDHLAARWNRAADIYLQNRATITLVRYEDFLGNKEAYIRHLAERLHLSVVSDISEKVDIQYQPRGNREVRWEDFYGERNLRRIEELCGSRMQLLGYDPTNRLSPTVQSSSA